jgi:hypothetical protein
MLRDLVRPVRLPSRGLSSAAARRVVRPSNLVQWRTPKASIASAIVREPRPTTNHQSPFTDPLRPGGDSLYQIGQSPGANWFDDVRVAAGCDCLFLTVAFWVEGHG